MLLSVLIHPWSTKAILNPLQLVGTVFEALLGLAFGSFLNVFLVRFPAGESVVAPRSHCRHCDHVLAWWENIPLLSWIVLRGRCRQCRAWIGIRYPLIELAIGFLWAACWFRFGPISVDAVAGPQQILAHTATLFRLVHVIGANLLCWLLLALAILDAEYFWLPDWLTLPGIAIGFAYAALLGWIYQLGPALLLHTLWYRLLGILGAGGVVLAIRLAYWLIRRQEGMGLGDAKLMAMLAAWVGLRGSLECFTISIFAAAAAAMLWLAVLAIRRKTEGWAKMPLPLGTFLCAAALVEVFHPQWLWRWWQRGL